MKLMDKLKNALFEEEYVEIEEKPKKVKPPKEKPKIPKEHKVKEKEIKKEEPIAKKIASEKPVKKEEVVNSFEEEKPTASENSFKFPMMDDDDLKPDTNEAPAFITDRKYDKKAWGKKKEKKKEYREYETKDLSYETYEEKKEPAKFKPSPIISPIYGVLDKNYKKEDVKDKKEIRLTSPYSRDKISVDDVRNKAFGSLEDVIEDNPLLEEVEPVKRKRSEEKVIDLGEKKPRVNNITMGEAEEYFEDLGLEYNKDYMDRTTSGEKEEEVKEEKPKRVKEEPKVEEKKEEIQKTAEEDDNLFDLIDSMYDE